MKRVNNFKVDMAITHYSRVNLNVFIDYVIEGHKAVIKAIDIKDLVLSEFDASVEPEGWFKAEERKKHEHLKMYFERFGAGRLITNRFLSLELRTKITNLVKNKFKVDKIIFDCFKELDYSFKSTVFKL